MVLIINISGIIIIYSFIFLSFNTLNLKSSLPSWKILIILPIFIYFNDISLDFNTIDLSNYLEVIKEDTIFLIILITLLIFFYSFLNILML